MDDIFGTHRRNARISSMGRVEEAFQSVRRADFVTAELREEADVGTPLPIGFGQTISQPTTVKLMLSWLDVMPGDEVLDVGSGSGWTTALLAHIVGPRGIVYAVERIPELVKFGRNNCRRLGVKNAFFFQARKDYGLREHAPYSRILVSASARELPVELLDQLTIPAKLVIPVQHNILEVTKTAEDEYRTMRHPGFAFVPLV
jgi:protein-L-isoaspartate(D-aspartate) O-methyltransferase